MKFSLSWLKTWVPLTEMAETLAEKLTMVGLEVEAISPIANRLTNVVVGLVETVEPHPNADKLRICQVNVGNDKLLTIVCGASNVVAGMKVPAALIGAKIGEDFEIKAAKLRGVDSEGMLCSAKELGIAEESEGLLPLPLDAPVGKSIVDYLDLQDSIIEIDLTPNRSDCLSIRGLARELSTIYRQSLIQKPVTTLTPNISHQQPIVLEAPHACPRYACQYLRDFSQNEVSPLWLIERLRRSGIRAIHPVVDITQYIMLEIGQPLHAFDAEKLQGDITVRFAKPNETLVLLDGKTVTLTSDMLVIADRSGAIALAGVMGGLSTAVSSETKHVLLESAYFAPEAIAGTARKLGLHTDAAHRFERGVDPEAVTEALTRASIMLHELLGGQVAPMQVEEAEALLPQSKKIHLNTQLVQQVLGIALDTDWVIKTLSALGLTLLHQDTGSLVWQIPSFRHDLSLPIDLVEELARLYGYDALPLQAAKRELTTTMPNMQLQRLHSWLHYLQCQGFYETVCYSFISDTLAKALNPDYEPYALANPLSPELAVMRTSLWGGLLLALKYNWHRQQTRIRLFEVGSVFLKQSATLQQPQKLALVALGSALPEQWGETTRKVDFYDIKSIVMPLLPKDTIWQLGGNAALHPGRSASLFHPSATTPFGAIGELHPKIAKALDLPEGIYLFEANIADLSQETIHGIHYFGKFPLIRRDLAFLVNREQPVGIILDLATKLGGQYVKHIELFDVYQGERIAKEKQSVAFRMTLQADDKTLTDEEVNQLIDTIIKGLTTELGAELRE